MAKSKNTKSEPKGPIQAESKQNQPVLIKVECVTSFWDLSIDKVRDVGEQWSITQKRLDEIKKVENATNLTIVKVI